MVEAEALQADVELFANLLAARLGREKPGRLVERAEIDLGAKHERVALAARQDGAEHLFVASILVAVRGVEQEDPAVKGGLHQVGIVGVHHAHADDGHLDARPAEHAFRRACWLGRRLRLGRLGRGGHGRRRRLLGHDRRAACSQGRCGESRRAQFQEIPSFECGVTHGVTGGRVYLANGEWLSHTAISSRTAAASRTT